MADIYSTKSNTLLSGTNYDDTIYNGDFSAWGAINGGNKVTIKAAAGNDEINNLGGKKF